VTQPREAEQASGCWWDRGLGEGSTEEEPWALGGNWAEE
jgi:hypothetical protein